MASRVVPDERGLADVGPAGHGQLDDAEIGFFALLVFVRQVQRLERDFDQAADALSVGR
jgi:hypothetical protein